jgi:hypothetical protein
VLLEQLVGENMLLLPADFVKVIHVELPHKRGEVLVSEVHRQNILLELLNVLHVEAQAVLAPGNQLGVFLFLNRTLENL